MKKIILLLFISVSIICAKTINISKEYAKSLTLELNKIMNSNNGKISIDKLTVISNVIAIDDTVVVTFTMNKEGLIAKANEKDKAKGLKVKTIKEWEKIFQNSNFINKLSNSRKLTLNQFYCNKKNLRLYIDKGLKIVASIILNDGFAIVKRIDINNTTCSQL